MDDLKKTINATLYERITSPLYGTFILSWIFSNWKAIYITLFVDAERLNRDKFSYITEYLYSDGITALFRILIIPGLMTYVFIWILPPLVNMAFERNEESKQQRRKIKANKSEEGMISGRQHLEIVKTLYNKLDEYANIAKDKEAFDKEKNSLMQISKEKDERITALAGANENLVATITKKDEFISKVQNKMNLTSRSLSDIFPGRWICKSVNNNGQERTEVFEIREGYQYFVNGKHVWSIDQYEMNPQSKSAKFRKVFLANEASSFHVEISLENDAIYMGNESLREGLGSKTKLVYRREQSVLTE